MITLLQKGTYLINNEIIKEAEGSADLSRINQLLAGQGLPSLPENSPVEQIGRANTLAWKILSAHNQSENEQALKLKFDALTSHDITFVGIIQTAIASGLKEFPVPYVLTNCHNSLCAVGGTINEDDHVFGLSAARKYGGIYVPAHVAVIHQYMREMMAGCGRMILGSDSHTRYGALGTMAIGEGGPEIVKQLLQRTYDVPRPEVIAIYLEGRPQDGVGPQDVALSIIKAVFKKGFVKNKVMEFVGPGVAGLSVDFRNGIDVMTTETTCLSSIWITDDKVAEYYRLHGRPDHYRRLVPGTVAYYDGMVKVNLSKIQSMIALPFHPSNVFTIDELNRHGREILAQTEAEARLQIENPDLSLKLVDKLVDGRLQVEQGIIVGCSGGTFENITAAAGILKGKSIGSGKFALSVYPSSQPVFSGLIRNGSIETLINAGATIRSAFCGPCFGAGDTPANNSLSIRHATRNFPNREGSKPANGQLSSVALMDARSIAATAMNGGRLTPATEVGFTEPTPDYHFEQQAYHSRVYQGYGKPLPDEALTYGPGIADWPKLRPLPEHLLLRLAAVIHDPVTTTDELIPSGETSSFRSNPFKLAEFTLSRKDPGYVGRAKAIRQVEQKRQAFLAGDTVHSEELELFFRQIPAAAGLSENPAEATGLGSVIFARKPGDGSAREQAASCQRVLGGDANIALEYATKRYRSNVINWGMIPFTIEEQYLPLLAVDRYLLLPDIRTHIAGGAEVIPAFILNGAEKAPLQLTLKNLSQDDRAIILAGCLINHYSATVK